MDSSKREENVLNAGLDEVGRGTLAGPLTIAVVAFRPDVVRIEGVKDSKKLSKKKRRELTPLLLEQAVFVGLGWASPSFIDQQGITAAWQAAAMNALDGAPTCLKLIVDGLDLVREYRGVQEAVVKADDKFYEVSAASIIAKEFHDHDMTCMAKEYCGYGWENNAGYGTPAHCDAIIKNGPTTYHRKTFLKKLLKRRGIYQG